MSLARDLARRALAGTSFYGLTRPRLMGWQRTGPYTFEAGVAYDEATQRMTRADYQSWELACWQIEHPLAREHMIVSGGDLGAMKVVWSQLNDPGWGRGA